MSTYEPGTYYGRCPHCGVLLGFGHIPGDCPHRGTGMSESLEQARKLLTTELQRSGIETEILSKYTIGCKTSYTEFKLSFLPGNRRTLVSHAVTVHPEHRGRGLGTLYCRLRERAAREAGVTLMLATVMDANKPEISLLLKCGWRRLTQNTTTHCSLWGKELQP